MNIIIGPQKRYTPPTMSAHPTFALRPRTLRAERRRAVRVGVIGRR